VNEIAISGGNLFAATFTGVFRSTDSGGSWSDASFQLPKATAITIAADANGKLYLSLFDRGMRISTDQGTTWGQTPVASNRVVLILHASTDGSVYAGTTAGRVLRTTDGGTTWQDNSSGQTNPILAITSPAPGVVLAGTTNGLFRSTDGGITWAPGSIVPGFVRSLENRGQGHVFLSRGQLILTGGELLESLDSGLSWQSLGSPSPDGATFDLASTSNGDLVAATFGGGRVFVSTDGGHAWSETTPPVVDFGVHGLVIDAQDRVFLATVGIGVLRSEDGGTSWSEANQGLTGYQVEDMAVTLDGDLVVATSASGTFRSQDRGASWQRWNQGLNRSSVTALAGDASGRMFVGTSPSGMFERAAGAASWTDISTGLGGNDAVTTILVAGNEDLLIGKASFGIWRRTGGAPWQSANCGLTDPAIVALVQRAPPDPILAGTLFAGVFSSPGPGSCWTLDNEGLPDGSPVRCMVLEPSRGDVFAETLNGMFRLESGVSSWIPTTLTTPLVKALATDAGQIFAGVGLFNENPLNDVLVSGDRGDTWSSIRGDLSTSEPITALGSLGSDLFAGMWHGGLFVQRGGITGVEPPASLQETRPRILTSRPNPFRERIEIDFLTAKRGHVDIAIYDCQGRLVRVLVDDSRSAGSFTAVWDGLDEGGHPAPSGIYLCRLHSAKATAERKIVRWR
jgi:photosystem II stability/assembly factor-like uncharacterized protein